MRFKDYYETLGVARNASAADIKKAYRRLARKFHPDVSKEKNAEERIKEINEAWEVLQDPEKRAAYDQLGADWRAGQEFRPPPGWQGQARRGPNPAEGFSGADFSEFFESLFGERGFAGAGASRAHTHAHAHPRPGEDQHSRLDITLEEAFSGGTRALTLRLPAGDASGRPGTRTLNVKIPPGVSPGQKIRLAGQGGTGSGGGVSGDIYLEVQILPHRLFRLDGRNLTLELPIAPWEAALGAKVDVPTLGGRVTLAVPVGAQSGQKLRLRGRGLPGDPPGDQIVRLLIVNPPADSEAAQELFRRMSHELAFDPRAGLA